MFQPRARRARQVAAPRMHSGTSSARNRSCTSNSSVDVEPRCARGGRRLAPRSAAVRSGRNSTHRRSGSGADPQANLAPPRPTLARRSPRCRPAGSCRRACPVHGLVWPGRVFVYCPWNCRRSPPAALLYFRPKGRTMTALAIKCWPLLRPVAAQPWGPGDSKRSLKIGDTERTYLVHVPPQYDAKKPTPVVLVYFRALPWRSPSLGPD